MDKDSTTNNTNTNSLELKLISCKQVKCFNFFQKLTLYALVSIETNHTKCDQQRTPTDKESGGAAEWNHSMRFDLSEKSPESSSPSSSPLTPKSPWSHGDGDGAFLRFDLRHEGGVFGAKNVGEVRVRLKDLIADCDGVVRFLSYQVRSDGKPNGVLTFSSKCNGFTTRPEGGEKEKEKEDGGGGRIKYPVVRLEDLKPLPRQQHTFPPPPQEPPTGFYPGVAPPCPAFEGGYYGHYSNHFPVRPAGWRVQGPWARPDPVRIMGGYDYYCNYSFCGGRSGEQGPPWSPGFKPPQ